LIIVSSPAHAGLFGERPKRRAKDAAALRLPAGGCAMANSIPSLTAHHHRFRSPVIEDGDRQGRVAMIEIIIFDVFVKFE
jgi:hypothetical protein